MENSFLAELLPIDKSKIDISYFMEEIIDASVKLEVYKEKIIASKLDSSWFMPTLQQKEALSSSQLEGTQATLEGVYVNQVLPNEKDKNLNEVKNYYYATAAGYDYLKKHDFSDEFFLGMHKQLMKGNVRKPDEIGMYRTKQNFIGKNDTHAITFVPPKPEDVMPLMGNLIDYMNKPNDHLRPLIRTAIIHAQFETIHPFMDGNGRVGRMLIPMYLYSQKQIDSPCFFISEALERDKILYYNLLNNIRYKGDWNEWIRFFLATVAKQCDKYISVIDRINDLYEKDLNIIKELSNSSSIISVFNELYSFPIATAKQLSERSNVPLTSVSRYLNMFVEKRILVSDNKARNRQYIYVEMLNILR